MTRSNLLQIPVVKSLLTNRWPQLIIRMLALGGFIFTILAGFLGTPVGSRNFAIVVVWIAWWAFLILIAIPFLGRGWCSICPIPMPGEWMQNGTLLWPRKRKARGLGKKWPKSLKNIWLQNILFTLMAFFSAVILTQPQITAVLLTAFIFIAFGLSLVFERRSFCRYVCPVGGFIGLYSQVAPVELRVIDPAICAEHSEKTCYTGNDDGVGCPWGVFPPGLSKNTSCGLCMECLRTCPYDNIAVKVRPIGKDLSITHGRRLDEAYKSFIMLGSAFIYSAVMLGPWGWLKTTAYSIGSTSWWIYISGFTLFMFGILPGLLYLAVVISKKNSGKQISIPTKQLFISQSYSLIPLSLAAWFAFSISFVFSNFSYVWGALSDPMGWGWNLLGFSNWDWTPYLTELVPYLQTAVLLLGFAGSVMAFGKISSELNLSGKSILPVMAYCFLITGGFLWLLVG